MLLKLTATININTIKSSSYSLSVNQSFYVRFHASTGQTLTVFEITDVNIIYNLGFNVAARSSFMCHFVCPLILMLPNDNMVYLILEQKLQKFIA